MEKDAQKQGKANDVLEVIKQQLTEKGPTATYAYVQAHLNQWKEENVTIAVTGTTGIGKSTFTNVIRGVNKKDEGFAPVGRGNTTKKPTYYQHPKNEKIHFVDLPGVGTLEFPEKSYCKAIGIEQYDIFLIFLGLNLDEHDLWLAETLYGIYKPFCFVRSKIDDDRKWATENEKNADRFEESIREEIKAGIQSKKVLESCLDLYLISNYDKNLGDWKELVSFIENNLSDGKKEAVLYALPNLTADVIEKKYSKLKTRLDWIAGVTGLIAAIPIPILDVGINLTITILEIKHYINVFSLSNIDIDQLEGFDPSQLNCRSILDPNADMAKLIINGILTAAASISVLLVQSVTDVLLPVAGSTVSAATTTGIVYNYLDRVLKDLKEDASVVYGHIAKIERGNSFRF